MSDNSFVRLDGLKAALSRVKIKVDSDITTAVSESATSLSTLISSGDSSTLSSAKSYADGLKTTIDSNISDKYNTNKGYIDGIKSALELNISNGDSSTLSSAKSYTDNKLSNFIRIYSNSEISNLQMENDTSFFYLNTDSKKILNRAKDSSGNTTETEIIDLN